MLQWEKRLTEGAGPGGLGLEDAHGAHHVPPADGALTHTLATLSARDHVTAFQQHAVDDSVHADPAQVLLHPGPDPTWVESTAARVGL